MSGQRQCGLSDTRWQAKKWGSGSHPEPLKERSLEIEEMKRYVRVTKSVAIQAQRNFLLHLDETHLLDGAEQKIASRGTNLVTHCKMNKLGLIVL